MSLDQRGRLIRLVCLTLLCMAGIFAIYFLLQFIGINYKCPILAITGFNCPGCGNTRAAFSILNFDILNSFSYNYLYPLEFLYIIWVYILSAKKYILQGSFNYVSPCKYIDVVVLATIVIWFPLRNIFGI